jgi:DNA-binding MarR family transcriptional regulator
MQIFASPVERVGVNGAGLKALFAVVNSLGVRLKAAQIFDQGEDSLASGGLSVLRVLDEYGPQSVPQIARLRGTSRQNIQILVNRLGAESCVELVGNPAHKRSGLVQLTGVGRSLFTKAAEREATFLAELKARVPEAEVASAVSLLRRLRQMLSQEERPAGTAGEEQVPREIPREGRRRVPRRKSFPPTARQKAVRAVVVPSEPEIEEGDLPYNLL